MKIAFIVSKFPCYDEAFILREIYALSHHLDSVIFSLRKSKEKVIHDQAAELSFKTICTPYFFSWKILGAHAAILLTRPKAYLHALRQLIVGNLRSPGFFFKSLLFFPKAVYLAHLAMKMKIDHLHAYWATYPASVALVASEIAGIPFSFTGHAHDIYLDTTHLKEKMQRAAFMTTCTSQNRDYLLKIAPGYPENKILVNYHGLPLDHFRLNGRVRHDPFEILSVGTLQYHKGFNFLLHAIEILRPKGLNIHCTIVGSGPLEQDLKKHIHMLKLESCVTMTGAKKQSAVIEFYKKSDVMVLMAQPEWHWGIPNVLIESLAAKTPVITTHFGSVEELVHEGETGLFVPSKDAQALANTVERLYRDEALRLKLAEQGACFVHEHFDLNKNIQKFLERFSYEADLALVA